MGRGTTNPPIPTKQKTDKSQTIKKPIANQHFFDLLIREGEVPLRRVGPSVCFLKQKDCWVRLRFNLNRLCVIDVDFCYVFCELVCYGCVSILSYEGNHQVAAIVNASWCLCR